MKKFASVLSVIIVLGCALVAQPEDRKIVSQQAPEYPAVLKKLGIGGTVKLTASVSAGGAVTKTKIDGGNPMLAEIACIAVKKWKFANAPQATAQAIEMTFDAKTSSVSIK